MGLDAPVISGTALLASDERLEVTIGGKTYKETGGMANIAVNRKTNTWSLQLPNTFGGVDYDKKETQIPIEIRAIDASGNTSTFTSTDALIIDRLAPDPPTIRSLTTNSLTPVVTGTAALDADDQLQVTVNDQIYNLTNGIKVDRTAKTWSLQLPTQNDGTYTITAIRKDAAGNVSATSSTSSGTLTILTGAPPAANIDTLDNRSGFKVTIPQGSSTQQISLQSVLIKVGGTALTEAAIGQRFTIIRALVRLYCVMTSDLRLR